MNKDYSHIPQHIFERLKKLLIFKDGAERIESQGEVEAASAAINRVITEYNIDLNDLDTSQKPKIVEVDFDLGMEKNEGQWVLDLWSALTKYNYCGFILFKVKVGYGAHIIGTEANIEMIKMTVDKLIPIGRHLGNRSFLQYEGSEKRNTFLRGFYKGFVFGIRTKLDEQRKQMEAENNKMTALVISNKGEIEKFINAHHSGLTLRKANSVSGFEGFKKGYQEGQKVHLGKEINEQKT